MDGSDSTAGIVGFLLLIIINAALSAALAALINVRRPHLRERADEGDGRARRVLALAEDSTPLLISRLFVNVLIHYLAATLVTLTIAQPLITSLNATGLSLDSARLIVYPATWLIGAVTMLLFGEMIPSALASANPDPLALALVGPLTILIKLLSPVSRLLLALSNWLASSVGGYDKLPYVTEEEIKTLVDAGQEGGAIEDDEKEMIYSIFQFNDKVVREVMVPRIDIVALPSETKLDQALDTILAVGHSRIPIYEGTIDRIDGLLYAKDLLGVLRDPESRKKTMRDLMRPAYFVPESKRAGVLLEELQARKTHMAIVIDEFGGTAGLVTIEDLLEEIVGDILDEYDRDQEAESLRITDDEYVFDARINLDDLNEIMEVRLSNEESDTLGGYVFSALGRVPQPGEIFEDSGVQIKVELITGRRIRKVRVTRLKSDEERGTGTVVVSDPAPAEDSDGQPERQTVSEGGVVNGGNGSRKRTTGTNLVSP